MQAAYKKDIPYLFITLTNKSVDLSILNNCKYKELIRKTRKNVAKLLKKINAYGALATFEDRIDTEKNTLYLHVHVVGQIPYILVTELSKEWEKISGCPIVYIKQMDKKNQKDFVRYIVKGIKYVTKGKKNVIPQGDKIDLCEFFERCDLEMKSKIIENTYRMNYWVTYGAYRGKIEKKSVVMTEQDEVCIFTFTKKDLKTGCKLSDLELKYYKDYYSDIEKIKEYDKKYAIIYYLRGIEERYYKKICEIYGIWMSGKNIWTSLEYVKITQKYIKRIYQSVIRNRKRMDKESILKIFAKNNIKYCEKTRIMLVLEVIRNQRDRLYSNIELLKCLGV